MVKGPSNTPILSNPKLILASASPRRKMLLEQIGIFPDKIISPEIDETPFNGEPPIKLVKRLAFEKSQKGGELEKGIILAADTIVVLGNRILGKAGSEEKAVEFLSLLSGRRHKVMTSVALKTNDNKYLEKTVTSRVSFKRLSPQDIKEYITSKEWHGKAGGYAIQGLGAKFIKSINGSYTNVVGLPLFEVTNLLEGIGYFDTKRNSYA